MGPGKYGPWPQCEPALRSNGWSGRKIGIVRRFCEDIEAGDIVVLRVGTGCVYGVGEVLGDYTWDSSLGNVSGWDLQHTHPVRWIWHASGEPKRFPTHTLKFGDTVLRMTSPEVLDWLQRLP